jgi:hypothetical protein
MPRPARRTAPLPDRAEWRHLHCSFCGRDANHVRFLSAGVAGGLICDACCFKAFLIFVKAWLQRPFASRT